MIVENYSYGVDNYSSTKNYLIIPPNDETWHISYIPPSSTYNGKATTALVVGQMQKFYILEGDFREQYKKLIVEGFEACYNFFCKNNCVIHQYSDKILPIEALQKIRLNYSNFLSHINNKNKE